jgi:hypothetical protein
MRIDSTGIYNNKGLVQNKNGKNGLSKSAAIKNNIAANKLDFQRMMSSSKTTETGQLSTAESSQIKQLFGQFDVSALKNVNNSNLDDGPGQFVDIVI